MWELGVSPLELVARTTIIYVLFFGALRLSGKRENRPVHRVRSGARAPRRERAPTCHDRCGSVGPWWGDHLRATIFVLNRLVAGSPRPNSPLSAGFLTSSRRPSVGTGDGSKAEFVARASISATADAALRQHGLERVEQMKLATLEEDGSISIVACRRWRGLGRGSTGETVVIVDPACNWSFAAS